MLAGIKPGIAQPLALKGNTGRAGVALIRAITHNYVVLGSGNGEV